MRPVLGGVLLFVAVPLFAQTAASVDVRVVNVDVAVVDGQGKAIRDLKPDDFRILEDGAPQKVTNFTVVERQPPRDGAARVPSDVKLRRRVILLVDNNYIDKGDRDRALRTLDQFVDTTFDGTYEWALAMIGQQLQVLQPFTTDKKLIHQAVAAIRNSATTSFRDVMDRSVLDDVLFQRGGIDAPAAFESRDRTARNARSLANTARGIIDAMHAFAATAGKKLVVLLTGSMDLNNALAGYNDTGDRELQDVKKATSAMIERIVLEANAANMSIHVIRVDTHQNATPQHDVSYHSSGNGIEGINMSASSDTRDTSGGWTIASGTGGLYLTSNQVRDSFSTIDSAASGYYLLGYRPAHDEDRQYHKIAVTVDRPGARLVYRQGYLDLPEEERIEQLLHLRISALQPAADVPVTLKVDRMPVEGKPVLAILGAMPMSDVTLLPRDGRYVGKVHVYLSIFDANGQNVGFHHQVQDLSLSAADHQKALADAFRYRMNVRLDKGQFTVAMTLRDDLSNQIGTAVQKINL